MSYFFLLSFCNLVMKSLKGTHFHCFKVMFVNFSEQFLRSLISQDIQGGHEIHFQEWFCTSKNVSLLEGEVVAKGENRISVLLGLHKFDQQFEQAQGRWQWSFKQKGGNQAQIQPWNGAKIVQIPPLCNIAVQLLFGERTRCLVTTETWLGRCYGVHCTSQGQDFVLVQGDSAVTVLLLLVPTPIAS